MGCSESLLTTTPLNWIRSLFLLSFCWANNCATESNNKTQLKMIVRLFIRHEFMAFKGIRERKKQSIIDSYLIFCR